MSESLDSLSSQVIALSENIHTPLSLTELALEKATQNASLNAFVALDRSVVYSQAEEASRRWKEGKQRSVIDGIPIAVKDNYLTKDYPTTACSDARPKEPSGIDATIIERLRNDGAIIFGKTNMHEWAYGATNSTSSFGPTRNPHNQDHITGGSSGGSGAAVAAGIVGAALGSDTGGSVRIPSGACGVYGFKPSYGRASRNGILPLSWALDVPGPLTKAFEDLHLILPYFYGFDPSDISTLNAKPFSSLPKVEQPKLVKLYGAGFERSDEVEKAINEALDRKSLNITSAEIKDLESYFAAWETILHCDASSYHAELLKEAPNKFSPVTRAHLEAGMQLTGVELLEAQRIRGDFVKLLLSDLPQWDALILPTLPVPAPRIGDNWQKFGGRKVSTQDSMTWFCWPGSLAGLPCISLPVTKSSNGLPIGIMLMGKPGQDEKLLSIAGIIDSQEN